MEIHFSFTPSTFMAGNFGMLLSLSIKKPNNINVTTFAQLLKAWGAFVTSTCATDAVELVAGLGADHVVDYSAADMKKQLESLGGYCTSYLVLLIAIFETKGLE